MEILMKEISPYVKLIFNIICSFIMFMIPNILVRTISDAGYSGEMFVSIYVTKTTIYVLILIIIMVSVNKFFSHFEKED